MAGDSETSRLKLAAAEYSTPYPHAAFSEPFFAELSFLKASQVSLPLIAQKGSISHWVYDSEVPCTAAATIILPNEIVPNIYDLQPMISSMEDAFIQGKRSVLLKLNVGEHYVERLYHFSKIRLFVAINNHSPSIDAAKRLVEALKSSSLSSMLMDRFMQERICRQIQGFSATCALWNLFCLLDKEWVYDDVLNCLSELLYFR
ncbi:hypothetical protein BT96DRAFT_831996, partial [Gymnopus androsaceus JB14]